MENVENKKFPVGMRVLAVDDDRLCLMIIEKLLQRANYDVTTVLEPKVALEMLRARKQEGNQFHLMITDVHMPDLDGFELLELISLEIDIPVIMLSANDELETMEKGIKQGACDYLVKPVCFEQVKRLWLNVLKKGIKSSNDDVGKKLQVGDSNVEKGCAKSIRKYSRKNKRDGHGTEVDTANTSTHKRKRIQWSGELHNKFVEVVHHIGIDKAVPKKILKMMNVPGLARENIASHLQKYRIYLQKVNLGTFKVSNPFANTAGWNKWTEINLKRNDHEVYTHKMDLGTHHATQVISFGNSSRNPFVGTNTTSAFGMHNNLLPSTDPEQPTQGNLGIAQNCMGSAGQDGSLLKDATAPILQHKSSQFISFGNSQINTSKGNKMLYSCCSGSSIANSSNAIGFNSTSKSSPCGNSGIILANISKGSPSHVRLNDLCSYGSILHQKILDASRGIPVDEEDDFQSIANDNTLAPTSQVPSESLELAKQHYSVQILPSFAGIFDNIIAEPSQFATPNNNTNNGEVVLPPMFNDIGHNGGTFEGPSQVNDPMVDEFLELLATSCHMTDSGSGSQNQIDKVVSEEAPPMVDFNDQQMAPTGLQSNTNSIVMPNDSCALGSASNIISIMPNGEGTSGNLAVNDSIDALQAVGNEQNNINNDPLLAAGAAVVGDLLNDDFFIDFDDDFFIPNDSFLDVDLNFDL